MAGYTDGDVVTAASLNPGTSMEKIGEVTTGSWVGSMMFDGQFGPSIPIGSNYNHYILRGNIMVGSHSSAPAIDIIFNADAANNYVSNVMSNATVTTFNNAQNWAIWLDSVGGSTGSGLSFTAIIPATSRLEPNLSTSRYLVNSLGTSANGVNIQSAATYTSANILGSISVRGQGATFVSGATLILFGVK